MDEKKKIFKESFEKSKNKMKGINDKQIRILQELVKNDEEYKKLLKRKKSGESVEDLISQNRNRKKKLEKERKENSKIALEWGRSEEGRKMFAIISMWARGNPNRAKSLHIEHEQRSRITTLKEKIKKIEEEYENLLERKNNGEFVDDLISENRYTADIFVEQDKKFSEEAMKERDVVKKRPIGEFRGPIEELALNEEEYKVLLEKKKAGESVKDLIKNNRKNSKVLAKIVKKNYKVVKKWHLSNEAFEGKKTQLEREIQALEQVEKFVDKVEKDVKEIVKNDEEYKILLERKKEGESVEDLIKQNRNYAEVSISNYSKLREEAMDWLNLNADLSQRVLTPEALQHFLGCFNFSLDKNKKQTQEGN